MKHKASFANISQQAMGYRTLRFAGYHGYQRHPLPPAG